MLGLDLMWKIFLSLPKLCPRRKGRFRCDTMFRSKVICRSLEMEQQALLIKGRKKRTPGYNSWRAMIDRCHNPRHESFRYYGARGIGSVRSGDALFENFIADLGPRPSQQHSLDRPHGGNYEPGRVVWATWAEQVASRADPDRLALSQAGKRSASIKRARKREAIELAGQFLLFDV